MARKICVTVLVVGLTVLAVVAVDRLWPHPPLDAVLTSPDAPPTRLVCFGSVDSRLGYVLLQPTRAGRVTQVFVKEKQPVSKDTPLVQLDDRLVKLQEQEAALAVQAAQLQLKKAQDGVKQYQAKRAEAEAALEAANSKVLAAEYALTRRLNLAKSDLIDPVEADVGRAQLNEARALVTMQQNRFNVLKAVDPELEVKLAQLQLKRSERQLDEARQDREEHLLRAPVNGVVLRMQVQEGDLVGPTSPRPAVLLMPAGAWIVRAEVAQEFAGRVREGLDVQVEDEASTGLLAKGRIAEVSDWFLPRRQISLLPTGINTGLTLECVIELEEGHAPLRWGQRVRVRVLADQPASANKGGR
jgi:multidrug resistance efflux pump